MASPHRSTGLQRARSPHRRALAASCGQSANDKEAFVCLAKIVVEAKAGHQIRLQLAAIAVRAAHEPNTRPGPAPGSGEVSLAQAIRWPYSSNVQHSGADHQADQAGCRPGYSHVYSQQREATVRAEGRPASSATELESAKIASCAVAATDHADGRRCLRLGLSSP
jgi:hypothetical protein